MGLFDKKTKQKSQEFDSPMETIDLNAAPPSAEPEPEPESERVQTPPPAAHQSYGIEEAIALMRGLPSDSVELVVQVVKHTLESTNIDIPTIIEDATKKQTRIDQRVALLKEEIADHEKEIFQRKDEIKGLEEDHKETSMVKDRLQLAEKLGKTAKKNLSTPPEKSKPLSKISSSSLGSKTPVKR